MHDALKREAVKKGLKGKRKDAFVFGSMRNTGWKPEREKTSSLQSSLDFEAKVTLLGQVALLKQAGIGSWLDGLKEILAKPAAKLKGLLGRADDVEDTVEPWAKVHIDRLKEIENTTLGEVGEKSLGRNMLKQQLDQAKKKRKLPKI